MKKAVVFEEHGPVEALKVITQRTAMIPLILVSGTMFTSIFVVHGGNIMVGDLISWLGFGAFGTILLLLAIVFVLEEVPDWVSIVITALPIFTPVIHAAGIDETWFAVLKI